MSNKAPTAIYFSKYMTAFLGKERVIQTEIRCVGNENDIKYLSEEYVNEILAEKDREIEEMRLELKRVNRVFSTRRTKG